MPVSIHNISAIDEVARSLQINPHQVRQLRNSFYKHSKSWEISSRGMEQEVTRERFTAQVTTSFLTLESSHNSDLDGATKLIFKVNRTGQFIETVILRNASGRTSVCVSSQVGCAANCAFCATGKMGLRGQLTRDEILDQIIGANRFLYKENRQVRNVVFMGMGEPFHNENALTQAIGVLILPACFNLTERSILVSTVGVADAMVRFAVSYPRAGLALSLHSIDQKTRESIIPIAARYPVDELREAIRKITELSLRPPMIEWLMLHGINDSPTHARALSQYLEGIDAHVNLIPYNEIAGAPQLAGSDPEVINRFAEELRKAGLTVTIRRSLGSDITAACGQLAEHAGQVRDD